jgi:hypothetical protein
MPGLDPFATGYELSPFVFDLLTNAPMALLFSEFFIDTADSRCAITLPLDFKSSDRLQDRVVNLFIDDTNVAAIRCVTKGNRSPR